MKISTPDLAIVPELWTSMGKTDRWTCTEVYIIKTDTKQTYHSHAGKYKSFTYPKGMEGWVDLAGWLKPPRWFTRLHTVSQSPIQVTW